MKGMACPIWTLNGPFSRVSGSSADFAGSGRGHGILERTLRLGQWKRRCLSLFSPSFGPFDTDPYANDGTGRIQGVETMMRLDTERMVAFAALTLSESTRVDRPGEDEQLFRYDQPYTLNVLASRELRKNRRLGIRIRSSSGYVYTPVVNRVYDLDSREFSPVFGERDSARLPPFFSLDIRFDKEWVRRRVKWAAYIDPQNATNTTNPEVMSWIRLQRRGPCREFTNPPAFGFRVEW